LHQQLKREKPVPEIPNRIFEIAQQLKENQQPRRATVRKMLKWFGAARRGANVIAQIDETLALAGLETVPPFADAGIDDHVSFRLRYELATAAPIEGQPDAPNSIAVSPEASFSPDILEPVTDEPPEEPTPAKLDDRPVSSQPNDWNLSTLRDKWDRGQLMLQPKYQREYVWKLRPELPSRLIESLLLEIPIPPIYFGKIGGGSLEVIDGQQRLTTMIDFISNKFQLRRLERMGSLNDKLFRDLTEEHQAKYLTLPSEASL
jgi:hypothetical protein